MQRPVGPTLPACPYLVATLQTENTQQQLARLKEHHTVRFDRSLGSGVSSKRPQLAQESPGLRVTLERLLCGHSVVGILKRAGRPA